MAKKKGGLSEYGGMETYKSKASKMKHEKAETKKKERSEKMAYSKSKGKK